MTFLPEISKNSLIHTAFLPYDLIFVRSLPFQLFFRYWRHVQSWSGEKTVVTPIRIFDKFWLKRNFLQLEYSNTLAFR